ncbi:MAG TPA: choice-of-anchor tandem repeat GloVer-containing protein [Rhizomicrobium sp.]|nr:choice-of-anchor tandem repeat GloVer-containing protein [Rhizomicrobium sp.]
MRLKLVVGLLLALDFASGAHAYTYKTLYSFCSGGGNCLDGDIPNAIVMDAAGDIYGTTQLGGKHAHSGVVYALVPNADKSAWTYQLLHSFCPVHGCPTGYSPRGKLVIARDGSLYGTTTVGGANFEKDWSGTIFKVTPNADRSQWDATALYDFCSKLRCRDGATPYAGLTYVGQASGALYNGHAALYGVAQIGGKGSQHFGGYARGAAFELHTKNGQLVERVIHDFCDDEGCTDGGAPIGGLLAGADGTLYGGAEGGIGINGSGIVYSLSHTVGSAFPYTILYNFCTTTGCPDGAFPNGDFIFDGSGNVLGTTGGGGTSAFCPFASQGCGTLFTLTPSGVSSALTTLHTFCQQANCADGATPQSNLVLDGSGNLFGAAAYGGNTNATNGPGVAFELNGSYSLIHEFCQQTDCTDGRSPYGMTMDADGNLFGVTGLGGAFGHGSVFELSP